MDPSVIVLVTIIHAFIAIFATTINIVTTHQRLAKAQRNDAGRLRTALAAELDHLRATYAYNIEAIRDAKDVVMSCRMFIAIYRGNLGRLHTLMEHELPAIVAAYAYSENIEGLLAAHCKAHGQSAYSMARERPYAEDLIALYERAGAAVDRALAAMGEAQAPAARRPAARRAALEAIVAT